MIMETQSTHCGWEVFGDYDVVVVGAGPGGVGAAISSARNGMRTLLIEKYAFPGGTGVTGCCPLYYGLAYDGIQTTAGVSEQIVRLLDDMGEASFTLENGTYMPEKKPLAGRPLLSKVMTRIESMRVAYRRLLSQAGVECLFYTTLTDVIMTNEQTVSAVLLSCLEGPVIVNGRVFIDATGDAFFFHAAGAPTRVYDQTVCMHKSLFFTVGGVAAFDQGANARLYQTLYEQGKTPPGILDHFGVTHQLNPGTVLIGFNKAIGNGVSSKEMTRMDGELREQTNAIIAFLQKEMPGFESCYLADTAIHVGVRAGRGIVGFETLDEEMIHNEKITETPIAMIGRSYGSHSNEKAFVPSWRMTNKGLSAIPLGALLSPSITNAIACGRCISADARVMDTFRMMNTCLTTGEAAGLLAGLAINSQKDVHSVPYEALRVKMDAAGFILPAK